MEISISELFDPLVRIIMLFHEDGTGANVSYRIFESLYAANISDSVNGLVEDPFVLSRIKWYDEDVDILNIVQKDAASTSHVKGETDEQAEDQGENISSKKSKTPKLKYAQVEMPVSQAFFQKITSVTLEQIDFITFEELYMLIMSNMFIILDNRQLLILIIVKHLSKDFNLYEKMRIHHYKKVYNMLNKTREFKMNETEFMELALAENSLKEPSNMVDEPKKTDNKTEPCNSMLSIYIHFYHWNNSFHSLVYEIKRYISFMIIDSQNLVAYSYALDDNCSWTLLNVDVACLNICYMLNHLSMDYRFLLFNEELLVEQFENADPKPTITLDINFQPLAMESADQLRTIANKLFESRFVTGDHIEWLCLQFYDLDIELVTKTIKSKKCSVYLNNCGFRLLMSLPERLKNLEIENMRLVETLRCVYPLRVFVCKNTVVDDDCTIIIARSCFNTRFIGVAGLIRYVDFGVVRSTKISELTCNELFNGKFSKFRMVNVQCVSNFIFNERIESLTFIVVSVISPFIVSLGGNYGSILLNNCTGTFNLARVNYVDTLRCIGSPPENLLSLLPRLIQKLIMISLKIDFNAEISVDIKSLKLTHVVVEEDHIFKLVKECDSILIETSMGRFNLFDKLNLIMNTPNNVSNVFSLTKKSNNGMLDLFVISMEISINKNFLKRFCSIILVDVRFLEPMVLKICKNVEKSFVHNFIGVIISTGLVNGIFTSHNNDGLTQFSVTKPFNKQKFNITIRGIAISEKLEIKCNTESIIIKNITGNVSTNIHVRSSSESIELRNHIGILDMRSSPYFQNVFFHNATLIYNPAKNTLSLSGILRLGTYLLPHGIKNIKLVGLILDVSDVFHLHRDLKSITIETCSGAFNFAGLLNIYKLIMRPINVVKVENLMEQSVTVHLSHLLLPRSLIISDPMTKFILEDITFVNEAIVKIGSNCQFVAIYHSVCTVHLLNETEHDIIICTADGIYEFERNVKDGLLTLKLRNACLMEQIDIPNNVQSIFLDDVKSPMGYPVVLNRLCRSLSVTNCTGIIICDSLKYLKSISISRITPQSLEIRFNETNDAMFEIKYEFTGKVYLAIVIRSTNLQRIIFRHGCLSATVSEMMSSDIYQSEVLHQIPSQHLRQNVDSAYDIENVDIDLISILKGHFLINNTHDVVLNQRNIIAIHIRYISPN